MTKKTLTPDQAARRLEVCRKTVYRMIDSGRINPDAVRNRGTLTNPRYRIDPEEIERIQDKGVDPCPRNEAQSR